MRKNIQHWNVAESVLVGGVNSPVRSGKAVGIHPPIIVRANGPHMYDVEGNRAIDLVSSWGALILGHRSLPVMNAVRRQLRKGTSYGATCTPEIELARRIREALPSIEKIRLVSSGTEAVMSAIRLARGATGRKKIIKFDGCYHGHVDSLLVQAGSGAATLSVPDSAGVPDELAQLTISIPYNDIDRATKTIRDVGSELAAVIVEPVAANMGVVPPRPGFLHALRQVTKEVGALLIFDEIITGFRVTYGGVQTIENIAPDLTCLGKIIGGGFPLAAYGGRAEVMDQLSPIGPVYQAGTLSGNPVAVAAGIATLKELKHKGVRVYGELEKTGAKIEKFIKKGAKEAGTLLTVNRVGSMLTLFFTNGPVIDYASAQRSDREKFAAFYRAMLLKGVWLPPSQMEAIFLSTAHDDRVIKRVGIAIEQCLKEISR